MIIGLFTPFTPYIHGRFVEPVYGSDGRLPISRYCSARSVLRNCGARVHQIWRGCNFASKKLKASKRVYAAGYSPNALQCLENIRKYTGTGLGLPVDVLIFTHPWFHDVVLIDSERNRCVFISAPSESCRELHTLPGRSQVSKRQSQMGAVLARKNLGTV